MSQTAAAPQVTGKMFLFEKPELLSKEQHSGHGISKVDQPFSFCAKVRAVPLTINEFPYAMRQYPIVFSSQENPSPLAILGVVDETNLFVDEQGQWIPMTYIPAYIRRYPFAIANETGGDRVAIVIDAGSKWITPGGDMPLFENGEPTKATNDAVEFCKQCEGERRMTEQMMEKLKGFDLIQGQSAQYTADGESEPRTFAQYFGVDEQRLNALSPERFEELRQTNLLPYIYAQLMSFSNWRELMSRRAMRFGLNDKSIFDPVTVN